jgi:ATP-dependent DNA helicase RecG
MKPSLNKILKILKLEAERGYDNHAVVGGLERMLDHWVAEARSEAVPEELIQSFSQGLRGYADLPIDQRAQILRTLISRLQPAEPQPIRGTVQASESSPDKFAKEVNPAAAPAPNTELVARVSAANNQTDLQAEVVHTDAPRISVGQMGRGEPSALSAPVSVISGVGPRYAEAFEKLGIYTLHDLLYHFPRRYDDYSRLLPINRLRYGDEVTVIGTIQSLHQRQARSGKMQIVEAIVSDGSGALRATWFNQPWLMKSLNRDEQIVLSGKVEQYLGRMVMNSPEWEMLDQQQLSTNRIVPVYPLTADITQKWLRKLMNQLVMYWAPRLQDPLPESLRNAAEVTSLPGALIQAHFPDSWETLKAAQQRLSFDEIFFLQLGVLKQKRTWQARSAQVFEIADQPLEQQISLLPYTLTKAQRDAINDLRHDLASGFPMNRLIQGDVGSGKTIVAALAISIVTNQGAQAALMAPTSILAEQHYKNFLRIFAQDQAAAEDPIQNVLQQAGAIRLMVGATSEAEKREIRSGLEDGAIRLVIGTHALIEDPVLFADLQFIVIDEQHRFGVEQRSALRRKGANAHLLVMTATPIPRSLALTVYGDLDVTTIDEMPVGRQPVSTHVLVPRERERAYALIRNQVQQGRQAFIVYPLIEENERSESMAAIEEQTRLQNEIFPNLKVGLLHGRMRPDEKDAAMAEFRDGIHHVLVSTTVIEVGVDVPNATVMLIEGANRFGLAQLHQLRGRVGRGAEKSYCLLIPDKVDQAENERLQVMAETTNGFILAERDLQQRGPGQFLGNRQSGYAELQFSNLTKIEIIEKARKLALALFEQDPDLNKPQHQLLATTLQHSWREGTGDIS